MPRDITFPEGRKIDAKSRLDEINAKSDLDVWKAFKNGDESAFINIYKTYAAKLFNYGSRFSADRELVKDCLQDFFLYLRKNRENISDTDCIRLYLFKSFRRRIIEYVKKNDKERQRNIHINAFYLKVENSDEIKYINRQLQEELRIKLNKALGELSKAESEIIYYFYYEGLSYREIAEIFNFTHISSARRLLYRTLRKLRDVIILVTHVFYIAVGA